MLSVMSEARRSVSSTRATHGLGERVRTSMTQVIEHCFGGVTPV